MGGGKEETKEKKEGRIEGRKEEMIIAHELKH